MPKKLKYILSLFTILTLVTTLFLVSAHSENMPEPTIQNNAGWKLVGNNEQGYNPVVFDLNKHKTTFCFVSKTATKLKDLDDYDFSSTTEDTKIKPKKIKAKDIDAHEDKYGYCYTVKDKDKRIHFGKNSIVYEWHNETLYRYPTAELDLEPFEISAYCNGEQLSYPEAQIETNELIDYGVKFDWGNVTCDGTFEIRSNQKDVTVCSETNHLKDCQTYTLDTSDLENHEDNNYTNITKQNIYPDFDRTALWKFLTFQDWREYMNTPLYYSEQFVGITNNTDPQIAVTDVSTSNSLEEQTRGEAEFSHIGVNGNNYLELDGSGDYVTHSTLLDDMPSEYSFSLWFKIIGRSDQTLISKRNIRGQDRLFLKFPDFDDNRIVFWGETNNGGNKVFDTGLLPNLDEWYHVTVTNDDTTCIVYVNGEEKVRDTDLGVMGSGTYQDFALGANYDGENSFNGSIDEVQIFNSALNSTEVQTIYNASRTGLYNYSHEDLVSHWDFESESSGEAEDKTGNNDGTYEGDAYSKGLVSYWSFDENARDLTNSDNDGTLNGDAFVNTSSGQYGGGLELDGDGDYVDVGDMDFGTEDWTISAWIFPTADGGTVFGKGTYNGQGDILIYDRDNYGDRWIWRNDHNSGAARITISEDSLQNEWHHITVTREGTTVKTYVDAINGFSGTIQADYSFSNEHSAIIGSREDGTQRYFNGSIDEVQIFSRALNSTEISEMYNSTYSRFYSEGNQTFKSQNITTGDNRVDITADAETLNGSSLNASLWEADVDANSGYLPYNDSGYLELDGNEDYYFSDASTEIANLEDNFTMSAWVNPDTLNSDDNVVIVSKYRTDGDLRSWGFVLREDSGNRLGMNFGDPSDGSYEGQAVTSAGTINTNEWQHVLARYDSGNLEFYINGVNTSWTLSGGTGVPSSLYNPNTRLRVGYWVVNSNPANEFDGSIDEVMIFNRSLSDSEIQNIYNLNRTQDYNDSEEGLMNYFSYDTGSIQDDLNSSLPLETRGNAYIPNVLDDDNSLVGYWHGDGNALDYSGQGNDGTFEGDANANTEGVFNNSFEFDGSGDYVDLNYGNNVDLDGNPITICAWANPSSQHQGMVWGSNNDGDESRFYLGTKNDDYWTMGVYTNSWGSNTIHAVSYDWQHLCMNSDGTTTKLYVDGVYGGYSKTISGIDNQAQDWFIGSYDGSTSHFNGQIDEVSIWNRSLSPEEIKSLYVTGSTDHRNNGVGVNWTESSSGSQELTTLDKRNYQTDSNTIAYWKGDDDLTDSSGNGNDLTCGGTCATQFNDFGVLNESLEFDDDADYFTGGSHTDQETLSFCSWNYNKGFVGTNDNAFVFQLGEAGLRYDGVNGDIEASSDGFITTLSTGDISADELNKWHFTCFTRDANNLITIYWDGVNQTSGTAGTADNSSDTLYIGANSAVNREMYGGMDEMILWNRTLTNKEVLSFYYQGLETKRNTYTVNNESTHLLPEFNFDDFNNTGFYSPTLKTYLMESYEDEGIIDTTSPNCSLVSRTPSDLEINSTGTQTLIINCTDESGINSTTMMITKTVNSTEGSHWSLRPPHNDKADYGEHFGENILLADGRVLGNMWYENNGMFSDNYTYAVVTNTTPTGQNPYINLDCSGNTCTINYTSAVEKAFFPSVLYLSRGKMEVAEKFNYEIDKKNGALIKFWDSKNAHGVENYTTSVFFNVGNQTDKNLQDLSFYYCNSSYNINGGTAPQDDSHNCAYLNSFGKPDIQTRTYSSRNSSYVKATYGVIDGKIAGIETTNNSYSYLRSDINNINSYYLRYANSSSGTNVSFDETNVAWTSSDDGETLTQADWTPDVWFSQISDGIAKIGIYAEDTEGNNLTNFSLIEDEIGDVNFPIGNPSIEYYNHGICVNGDCDNQDYFLNKSYSGNMSIKILIAIDPDEVGAGNHTLELWNTDGTYNTTINASFFSSDDSDMNVYFDTTTVPDGEYKMNISVVSTEDGSTASYLTTNNFTIKQAPKVNINYPINGNTYTQINLNLNYTVIGNNLNKCWYSKDGGATNSNAVNYGTNFTVTGSENSNTWTVYCNDTYGEMGNDSTTFTINLPPELTINNPTDGSNQNLVFEYEQTCTDTQGVSNEWYTWLGTNYTYTNPLDLTASAGSYNITGYCNDTYGNLVTELVNFDIVSSDIPITNETKYCKDTNFAYNYLDNIRYKICD